MLTSSQTISCSWTRKSLDLSTVLSIVLTDIVFRLSYGNDAIVVQLIDFGQAIDMNFFPNKTTFSTKLSTENFICTEMKENKPWTFQLDLFCAASTIYSILIGKYMTVVKQNSIRCPYIFTGSIPRHLNKDMWTNLFLTLINVPDCNSMPNLQNLRLTLKEAIELQEKTLADKISQFNTAIA